MTDHYKMRSSSVQLPSAAELIDILAKESQRRAVRFNFLQKNNAVFETYRTLAKLAGIDDSWIDHYAVLSLAELMRQVDEQYAILAQYIVAHPKHTELYADFYNALIPATQVAKADAIFVFGAATNARIERAVELYHDGVAPKIIVSGDSPHYLHNVESEARRMGMWAQENDVPRDALILEELSVTLPDNVKRTLDMFEQMQWQPKSLTIVATNFVLMRAVMEWYKFCPWGITIIPVAAYPQSSKFTAEGWYTDVSSIALVLNEYVKLVVESKIDLMRENGEIV